MKIKTILLSVFVAVSSVACGGSGGGSAAPPPPTSPPPPPVGGIGRTGFAVGPVTTFGSIVVNGVHYATDDATFENDGEAAAESDLKVGQVVVVQGTISDDLQSGSAASVIFDDAVKGPVQSIDMAQSRLVVLGQTVLIGAATSFDDNISPRSLAGLVVADLVEVSGLFTATGEIDATRIEKKPAGTPFEVHGSVSNLDAGLMTFSINALTVEFGSAVLDNFPGGQISADDFVEAKGTTLGSGGELNADKVELEVLGIGGDEGAHVEIEGFITRFDTAADFDVSGFPVVTNGGTVFEGGTAANLDLNVKVEVEGDLDGNGVLVADKIDIRRGSSVRVTALVDSVDAATDSLVMLGIAVTTDALTRFEDKSDADVRPLTLDDLNAGDYVEVRGSEQPGGSNQMQASLLERDDIAPDTELQGFVSAVSDPTLTILGVTIETGSATFRDVDNSLLTRQQFFDRVAVNSLVKATGTESSATTITAREVEFENEF